MARKKNTEPSWWVAAAVLILGLFSLLNQMQLDPTSPVAGSGADSVSTDPAGQQSASSPAGSLPPATSADTITVASFNIQVFGQSKLADRPVLEKLAHIVRQFDVVAIQEIRSKAQDVMPRFVEVINSSGREYRFLIGPRLGRTSSKEQYAYVYRADRLEPIPGSVFNVQDPQDLLHREPYVASFRTRTTAGQPFSFTLINAHTDPDEADWEVSQLAQVYQFVTSFHRHEDDIILLGDLNVGADGVEALSRIPVVRSIVPAGPTNTRGTKQYDHILVNQLATAEFTGRAGVMNMAQMFQITPEQALELSDHEPIWAEFSTLEQATPSQLAMPADGRTIR